MSYDVVVVGGGLAGLTAGLYTARFGLRTLVLEPVMPGGQVMNVESIETFPGFGQGVSGAELGPIAQLQAEAAGAQVALDTAVALQRPDPGGERGGLFRVQCTGGQRHEARAVIVATGSSHRSLGIPGEVEFTDHGMSHCAACDGHSFVGKRVCVAGGGDSALEEALVLVEHGVKTVLLVHPRRRFRAQKVAVDRVEATEAIEPVHGAEIVEIRGDTAVREVVLRRGGGTWAEAVEGVFVFIGQQPNSAWLDGTVDLDSGGHVVTDTWLRTSLPGVFAAGDVRQNSAAQLVASAGDGATAAVAAARYLAGVS
jgi:thioredoxin reductase (NADPH)